MDTVYLSNEGFKPAVKELKAELRNMDGHMRWVCKREDGTEFIIRPESARMGMFKEAIQYADKKTIKNKKAWNKEA